MKKLIVFIFIFLFIAAFPIVFKEEFYCENLNDNETFVNNFETEVKGKNKQVKEIKYNAEADEIIESNNNDQLKAKLIIVDDTNLRVNRDKAILPILVRVSKVEAHSVNVEISQIISEKGELIFIRPKIEPDSIDISPEEYGEVFTAKFDPSEIEKLDPGNYTARLFITADNAEQLIAKLNFEIPYSETFFSSILQGVKWISDNLAVILWHIIEIIFFIFLIWLIIMFLRLAWKGRRSLNVLPISNETGEAGEIEGVAYGIDDILMTKLQDIKDKSRFAVVKHFWLTRLDTKEESKGGLKAQAQSINVVGGGIPMELQKLGDISIGAIKIPLSTFTAFFTKILGGNYISGALQKYGTINKIVLRLEKRNLTFKFYMPFLKQNIRYFEASWPSKYLPEGVPEIVDELAYRITLNIDEKAGTENWIAYKYFLDGYLAYKDYEENKKRRDRLKEAIYCWRESIRLDPNFAKAYFNLAVALDRDSKYEDAIFRYQNIIEMSPEIAAEAHFNLAMLYWEISKDESKTLDELNKARELEPELADIYNLYGLIFFQKKKDEKASRMFEKAIQLSRKNSSPVFYYNLSVAQYYLENYAYAQKVGEHAKRFYIEKKEKIDKRILQTMGWVHIEKGAHEAEKGIDSKAIAEYQKAKNYFEEGLEEEPNNPNMLEGYGKALRELGCLPEAMIIQRRYIRLWPEYFRGYYEIAKTLNKKLNPPKYEISLFEKVGQVVSTQRIRNNIDNLENTLNIEGPTPKQAKIYAGALGSISYYFENYAKACENFERMLQPKIKDADYLLEPESLHIYGLALMKLKKYENACQILTKASSLYQSNQIYDLAECNSDLAKAYVGLAAINFKETKNEELTNAYKKATQAYQNAINLYRKAKLFDHASQVHVRIAECLLDWLCKNCYEKARDECNKALLLNNKNSSAYHLKGYTYYKQALFDEAIPQYEKALELNFNMYETHYSLGLCHYMKGNFKLAVKQFETVIKLNEFYADPYNENKPDPYHYIAYCLEKQEKLDKATEALKKAVNIFQDSAKYRLLLGQVLEKRNLLDDAAIEFKNAINCDKNNDQGLKHLALNYLADLYADQGADLEQAYSMSRKALVIAKGKGEKHLAQIRNTLGWICYQKNKNKEAITFLEKSLVNCLGDPKSHARLAYAYIKQARTCSDSVIKTDCLEKAKVQWRIVLELDVQNRWRKIAEEHLKE